MLFAIIISVILWCWWTLVGTSIITCGILVKVKPITKFLVSAPIGFAIWQVAYVFIGLIIKVDKWLTISMIIASIILIFINRKELILTDLKKCKELEQIRKLAYFPNFKYMVQMYIRWENPFLRKYENGGEWNE